MFALYRKFNNKVDNMKRLVFSLTISTFLCAGVSPCVGDLIWDYSPLTTGGSGTTSWQNVSTFQNFAEVVSFANPVTVTGMDIYSNADIGSVGNSATIRIRSDAADLPGGLLFDFTETISIIDSIGATAGNNRKHVDFTVPVPLAAGTPFWIGMSGTTVGLRQMSLLTNPPADSRIALFNGTTFQGMFNIGDMAFRLHGDVTVVPEPSSFVLFGLGSIGFAVIGWRRKRKSAA